MCVAFIARIFTACAVIILSASITVVPAPVVRALATGRPCPLCTAEAASCCPFCAGAMNITVTTRILTACPVEATGTLVA